MLDEYAGFRVRCPGCGGEMSLPDPVPPEAWLLADEPGPRTMSPKAIASLALGVLFIFACFTGLPAIALGGAALDEIGRSKGRLRGRGMAIAGIALGMVGCLIAVGIVAFPGFFSQFREPGARRAQCFNNLKQIGLALHNYHDAHGTLPAAAIVDRDGRPLLSWRVALLPQLEHDALYAKFHLDEPWDSPHNLPLVESMPSVYGCPSDWERKSGETGYQAVLGPKSAFTSGFMPLKLADFTDGTDQTLAVGETHRTVPWTKPQDLSFQDPSPLHGLGSRHSYHSNGFNVLFVDGGVRWLKTTIAPNVLDALLTRNGGEAISADSY
jgi:prepilin-type processing-associated H-X9-DG protein